MTFKYWKLREFKNHVNLRLFSSIEDIREDLVTMADLRVTEFLLEIPLFPQSLRILLNEDKEWRLKSFRFIPDAGSAEWKGRFDWQDMREMKLPPEVTDLRSKALTTEIESSSLLSWSPFCCWWCPPPLFRLTNW